MIDESKAAELEACFNRLVAEARLAARLCVELSLDKPLNQVQAGKHQFTVAADNADTQLANLRLAEAKRQARLSEIEAE